jgi:hypothetical protein
VSSQGVVGVMTVLVWRDVYRGKREPRSTVRTLLGRSARENAACLA